jgi:hypothetical protein
MPDEFKKLYSMYTSGKSASVLTYQDIAFVIPDRLIEPIGYPNWITEILVPSAAEKDHEFDIFGFKGGAGSWTPELRQKLDTVIGRTFGSLNSARAIAVGYGNFACSNYNSREGNCVSDNRKRFGHAGKWKQSQSKMNAALRRTDRRFAFLWVSEALN